jgi:hypothetical protein
MGSTAVAGGGAGAGGATRWRRTATISARIDSAISSAV